MELEKSAKEITKIILKKYPLSVCPYCEWQIVARNAIKKYRLHLKECDNKNN